MVIADQMLTNHWQWEISTVAAVFIERKVQLKGWEECLLRVKMGTSDDLQSPVVYEAEETQSMSPKPIVEWIQPSKERNIDPQHMIIYCWCDVHMGSSAQDGENEQYLS